MNREEQINEWAIAHQDSGFEEGSDYGDTARVSFIAGAKAADANPLPAPEQGWTDVNDKLPEEGKYVLFYNGYWMGVGRYAPSEWDEDMPDNMKFQDETTEYIYPAPTYWRPRPAPPSAPHLK